MLILMHCVLWTAARCLTGQVAVRLHSGALLFADGTSCRRPLPNPEHRNAFVCRAR